MFTKKIALTVLGTLLAGGIALADRNGGGKLDDQDRAAMRAEFQAKRAAHRAKMLAEFDTNKDGKLEPEERAAMKKARAEKLFARLDTNGDGQISLEEFEQARMFRHHHHRRFGGGFGGWGGAGGEGGAPNGGQP